MFILLAGIMNANMDVLKDHFDISVYAKIKNKQFWDPRISSINKYKLDDLGQPIRNTPRFWGATTMFVMFTDGWHLFKFLMLLFISLAIASMQCNNDWYFDFIVFYILFTSTFELNYRKLSNEIIRI
jgi:hypothetical protein